MKRMILVLLAIALLWTVALPAAAETTAKPIPFSGWEQGSEGNHWNANPWDFSNYFGQAALCQSADDLTGYLQKGEYPLNYGEVYYNNFFEEKSLLLLEVFAPQLSDQWYVKELTQVGEVLNCSLVFDSPGFGPDAAYTRVLCVELTEKPSDIQALQINITYDGLPSREPASLTFPYEKYPLEYTLGDVNCDGQISAADALMVLKSVVGKETLTYVQQIAAKTNKPGTISAGDALCILQKVVGKIDSFPIVTYMIG